MSRLSISNSLTTRDVLENFTFTGEYVNIVDVAEIDVSFSGEMASYIVGAVVTLQFSNDKVNINEEANNVIQSTVFSGKFEARYTNVRVLFTTYTDITGLNLTTILKGVETYKAIQAVIVENFPEPVAPIIPEVSSNTRTAAECVIGQWFKVETLGNTIGAVWHQMGAIIGSESNPPIGRVFKCIMNGNGTGTVSLIIYNSNVVVDNFPVTQVVSGPLTDAELRLTAVPVSGPLTDAELRLTAVPVSGPLTDAELRLTAVPVSGPLTDAELRLTAVPVSGSISLLPAADPNSTIGTVRLNDAYGSPLVTTAGNLMIGINNIYTTNALHTIIDSIDTAVTFQCQERPTTESYFTTSVGTGGLAITFSPKTLRNFSFNTTSAVIVYVMLYDTGLVPIITDTPIFVFPIMNANNVIFNSFDHKFVNGLGLRAVTTYAGGGTGNPVANTVFINMTLSD